MCCPEDLVRLLSSKAAKQRRQPKAAPTGRGIWLSQISNQSCEAAQTAQSAARRGEVFGLAKN